MRVCWMSVMRGLTHSLTEPPLRTGAALELHHAIPTAILFARRYYATKAMQENDRFIVVCACLFLAGKCEEEMKPLNDVCYQTYKIRHAHLSCCSS